MNTARCDPAFAIDRAVEVALTSRGLEMVPFELHQDRFEFVVGRKRYRCVTLIAEFLSPKISRLRHGDASMITYYVETEDPQGFFGEFLSLGRGRPLAVDPDNAAFFMALSVELENMDLRDQLLDLCDERTELTPQNATRQLRLKQAFYGEGCDTREIEYIAAHFGEIPRESLLSLDFVTLSRLLASESLLIESEDMMFDFVMELIGQDSSYVGLLEFVLFENLTDGSIEVLTSKNVEAIIGGMNNSIWMRICRRLRYSELDKARRAESIRDSVRYAKKSEDLPPASDAKSMTFDQEQSRPLDGIISYLTRENGGQNIVDSGIITIDARPVSENPKNAPRNVVDFDAPSYFCSQPEPNQSLYFDFLEKRITPTGYTIRSNNGACHPKSWVIEVSNDGSSWTEVDRKENNYLLNKSLITASFRIERQFECRMIRIRLTGKNHAGDHRLVFAAFEVFGVLTA